MQCLSMKQLQVTPLLHRCRAYQGNESMFYSHCDTDAVYKVAVFNSWAAKVGFPVSMGVATNIRSSNAGSNLHFFYQFGDEVSLFAACRVYLYWYRLFVCVLVSVCVCVVDVCVCKCV